MGLVSVKVPSREDVERFGNFDTVRIKKYLSDPYIKQKYDQLNSSIYLVCEFYRKGASYGTENRDQLAHWIEAKELKDEILKQISIIQAKRPDSMRANVALIISVIALVLSTWKMFSK